MASYASEFSYPNFVHYSHTLGSGDYEMTGTYGEPLPSLLEEFGFSYPGPVSSPNGGVVYQTSRPSNEYTPWLGIESYFDRYWGEGLFPHGSGFETFNNPYGDELVEKTSMGVTKIFMTMEIQMESTLDIGMGGMRRNCVKASLVTGLACWSKTMKTMKTDLLQILELF